MAHLLEEYAKNLGVKVSHPVVKDHFFPLKMEKYITIGNDNTEAKHYPYYGIVLNLLRPFLERARIKVVQLGGKSRIEGVDAALNLSFKQGSFILSRSLVHIGSDGVMSHLASAKQVPTVNLFGNTFPHVNRPLFSKSSSNINLSPEWDKKPCLGPTDHKKQIATIKAELVAQSVLDFLKIEKEDISFTTKYVGGAFTQSAVEVVPTAFTPLTLAPNQLLTVRADYGFNEEVFMNYCKNYPVSICIDKLIQPHGLQPIASNVANLFILIDAGWDDIPDNYFKILKNLNINAVLFVRNEEEIPALRNKYFDIPVRPYYSPHEAPCELDDSARFISSKRIIESGKEYLSYAHWKKGLDGNNKVLHTPEYWRELDHFYIYEQN
jgi:hypothetical protein